jgi:hypothetical protein
MVRAMGVVKDGVYRGFLNGYALLSPANRAQEH